MTWLFRFLFVSVLLAGSAGAEVPEAVWNFDVSTDGLEPGSPSVTWASADVAGSPRSGSARVVTWADGAVPPLGGSVEVTASPCFVLQPGEQAAVTGSVWVDEAGAGDAVGIGFAVYDDLGCDVFAAGWRPLLWQADTTASGWQAGGKSLDGDVWGQRGVRVLFFLEDAAPGNQVVAYFDGFELSRSACEPGAPAGGQISSGQRYLCLNDGRFKVGAEWRTSDGVGHGGAVPFSADSGSFWFFRPGNLELDVKALDGCGLNGHYWVFAAGLTDVEVTLTVLDTVTGQQQSYFNPLDQTFVTITDIEAFDACAPAESSAHAAWSP